MEPTRNRLVLATTPISSYTHASPTLWEALSAAGVTTAEDTRRLAALLRRIDVVTTARMLSYFGGNEAARTTGLTGAVIDGQDVVLVTDAGIPSVGNPGYRLTAACVERDLPVTVTPRPSAVLTALAVSGLPCDRFYFKGLLLRKARERRTRLAELTAEERTMTFFEASHRLHEWLLDATDALDADRWAVVYRGLTRPYEEIVRDDLIGLAGWATGGVHGEVTAVVTGAGPARAGTSDTLELMAPRVADGEKLSQAVHVVAGLLRVPRKELYEAVLAARKKER